MLLSRDYIVFAFKSLGFCLILQTITARSSAGRARDS